ncbi:MAG: sigma-54 dependent transcriptional regulator [Nitrospiraceae bacterium]|nr:sigma-54 dependent transcriptional regulator [Nitrospiraceae bacterium]
MRSLLIVDDDEFIRDSLKIFFEGKGFKAAAAPGCAPALDYLKNSRFDIILMDLIMPEMGGLELLKRMAEMKITTPSIVMTAFATVQTAVEAMKLGAFDYITKPFVLEELMMVVDRAIGVSELRNENRMLRKQLRKKYRFDGLIGDSPRMQAVYEMIEKVLDIDSTILITGESGTGKELIAKTIHFNSSRSQQPFVPLNCAAIPKDLLESELFGHEKGAFTGALNTRIGRFELARDGTLFLDEIGEMDIALQGKILRVIQGKEFERVGGSKTIKVDVRIVTASNKDLERAIEEGKFREDLYYRLNVIPIHLPPLRERREDILLLLDFFKKEFAKKRKKEPLKISDAAMKCILGYHWPGNVRELENLMERLTILATSDTIGVHDLPPKFRDVKAAVPSGFAPAFGPDNTGIAENAQADGGPVPGGPVPVGPVPEKPVPVAPVPVDAEDAVSPDGEAGPQPPTWAEGGSAAVFNCSLSDSGLNLSKTVEQMERSLILQALEKTGGVKSKAAKLLGLNRTTLIEKMKKMDISARAH